MPNILDTFFILFKSNTEEVQAANAEAQAGAEATAAAVDAVAAAHATAGEAAAAAGAASAEASGAATAGLELETAAAVENAAAYAFNRAQRQEFVGLARHSFDQLASGGSIMRVVTSHAATLAEALSNGPGGLSAGVEAATAAAGRFIQRWGLLLGVVGAGVALFGTVKGSVKDLEATRLGAQRANMGVSDFDAIRRVVRNLGGDAKEAERDMQRFATRIDDAFGNQVAKKPDAVAKAFAAVGVHLQGASGKLKDTKQLMLDLSDAMAKASPQRQAATLKALGFETPRHGAVDKGLRDLLTGGAAHLQQLIETEKQYGVVTAAQVELAHKYKLETEELGDRLRNLRNIIATWLLPALTDFTEAIRHGIEWMQINRNLVQGMGVAILALGVIASRTLWTDVIPATIAWAVATLAAVWPWVLLAAAIGAVSFVFGALWDDVKAFLNGQPSLLGELVNKYEGVRKAVHAIGEAWDWVKGKASDGSKAMGHAADGAGSALTKIWRAVHPLVSLISDTLGHMVASFLRQSAQDFGVWLKAIGQFVKGVGVLIGDLVAGITHAFLEGWRLIEPTWMAGLDRIARAIGLLLKGARDLLGLAPDKDLDARLQQGLPQRKGAVPFAPGMAATGLASGVMALQFAAASSLAAVPNPGAGRGPVSRQTDVHIAQVTVNTQATDADGIAGAFAGALGAHLRETAALHDDGVDR